MSSTSEGAMATQQIKQDEVDDILKDKDGKIYRQIDEQL